MLGALGLHVGLKDGVVAAFTVGLGSLVISLLGYVVIERPLTTLVRSLRECLIPGLN